MPSTTEKTLYKTSPTWGMFLFSKSCQDLTQCSAGRFRNSSITGSCLSILANGQRGCAEAEQSSVQSLPASLLWAPACRYKPTKWDLNMGWFASCAWTTNPASQPNIYTVIMLTHISNCTQYCWPLSLNISKRKVILDSSALFSFPFLKN